MRARSSLRSRVFAPALIVWLLAGACSTADGSSSNSGTSGPPILVEPAEVAPPSGNLRIDMLIPLATWNPHAERREVFDTMYSSIFETLLSYDNDLNLRPNLALSWTVNDESLQFRLVEGVEFHDGTAFNAEAVKWNIDHARGTPGKAATAFDAIEEVEVIDNYTVRLTLKRPSPQLLWKLTQSPGMMISPTATDVEAIPVGTGPWMIDTEASRDDSWEVTLNSRYRNPVDQGVETITYSVVERPTERFEAMMSGEIDVALIGGPEAPRYLANEFSLVDIPTAVMSFTFIDRGPGGVFEDRRVRQAVAHAIDRVELAQDTANEPRAVRYTRGEYGGSLSSGGYEYDLSAARRLLRSAGVTDLSIAVPSFFLIKNRLENIQEQLAKVGIDVEIVNVGAGLWRSACTSGEFDACLHPVVDFHPASYWEEYIAPGAAYNPHEVPSPAKNEVAIAYAESDFERAEPLWAAAMQTIVDDIPATITFQVVGQIAYNPSRIESLEPIYNVANGVRLRGLRLVD